MTGLLLDRMAPDHLMGNRLADLNIDRSADQKYLQSLPEKVIHFVGHTREGNDVVIAGTPLGAPSSSAWKKWDAWWS